MSNFSRFDSIYIARRALSSVGSVGFLVTLSCIACGVAGLAVGVAI